MASSQALGAESPRLNILVSGATGKQGSALIRALLHPSILNASHAAHQYHIYALTRKASSPNAQRLSNVKDVTVVEGDLDAPESISKIFQDAKSNGGIWGVFAVLAFPGWVASADGEERQGKMLADLALEFGVSAFVYSSGARFGPKYEDDLLNPSHIAKRNIEQYCISLGAKGLPWIIMRPGFFMENFNNFIGSIAVTVLKTGLKGDTQIGMIASEDIGNVAAEIFRNPEPYMQRIMVLVGDHLTMSQLEESYKRGRGRSIPAVPNALAWLITKLNLAAQDLPNAIERYHHSRTTGEYPELEEEIHLANEAYRMRTYYEWISQGEGQKQVYVREWNKLSIWNILTGRS